MFNKIKTFLSDTYYNLINGGTGGAMILLGAACAVYYVFFSVGGSLVLPLTLFGFGAMMFFIIKWLIKNK